MAAATLAGTFRGLSFVLMIMRFLVVGLLLSLTFFSLLLGERQATGQSNPAVIALVGGRVFPSPESLPIDDATVVIQKGRIAAVGPRAKVAVPSVAVTLDARTCISSPVFKTATSISRRNNGRAQNPRRRTNSHRNYGQCSPLTVSRPL